MNLSICIYSWYQHQNPGDKHIHHLQKHVSFPLYVLRSLTHEIYTRKFLSAQHHIILSTPYRAASF